MYLPRADWNKFASFDFSFFTEFPDDFAYFTSFLAFIPYLIVGLFWKRLFRRTKNTFGTLDTCFVYVWVPSKYSFGHRDISGVRDGQA